MKRHKLAIFIAVILFIAPFFWLNIGEMNLGGDAGRLYFYDPLSFINNYALYNFVASGKGAESGGYVFFPFTFTLYLLKFLFQSPTILIALFNGIILSTSFLSIYFIVRELINGEKPFLKGKYINYSSILAGLGYIFSQELMNAGWETPIITHNQFFLNPLIFLLILKYFLTRNYLYIIAACLISLIFSANFSFIGSPTFFAFYPLSLAFILCYTKYVRKMSIPYKGLGIGILLFLLLHSFHLVPELLDVFSFDSANNKTVFSVDGIASRSGLDYFIAIAASTRVSLAWLGVAQFQNDPKYIIFILFPFVLLEGFFFNRGKTFLLTGIFFLITLFFSTANITDIGFYFYKLLFKIPGFSMFRNFHGQWLYVFVFFYTLLFGQACALVVDYLNKTGKYRGTFFIGAFALFLVVLGIPFLNGSIPIPRHENGIRYAFRMDPVYEDVLEYFREYPVDGKVILFPLTGPGYQILQGVNGNGTAYQGLSLLSYLVGRSDFAGFGSLDPYDELLLRYMKEQNFEGIARIFSLMNIHQIFYNSDPFIFSKPFQPYLYAHVSGYNPKTQSEYKNFIEKLPIERKDSFGDIYNIYTLQPDGFLPHVFTTTDVSFTNNQVYFSTDAYLNKDSRGIPISLTDTINENSSMLFGLPSTFLSNLKKNIHLHKHNPFVSVSIQDQFYPLVLLKEKFSLYRLRNDPENYLNFSLLYLTKRIYELEKSGKMLPVYMPTENPKLWEFYRRDSYNNWDASLARYQKGMDELIDWSSNRVDTEVSKQADRVKINEQLFRHQLAFLQIVKASNKTSSQKQFLLSKANNIFDQLFQKVNVPIYDPFEYYYNLPSYPGNYEVFSERGDTEGDFANASIIFDNKTLKPLRELKDSKTIKDIIQFESVSHISTDEAKLTLQIPQNNLARNARWSNSGNVVEANAVQTLTVNNAINEDAKGLMLEIPNVQGDRTYIIDFEYMTEGDNFIFAFFDTIKSNYSIKTSKHFMYFEKLLNSKSWKFHQSILTTRKDVGGGILRFSSFSDKEASKILIRNLSVTKVEYPRVILQIKNNTENKHQAPNITFTRINSTKYSVRVENANHPYALVLLESFNDNWNLIDPTRDNIVVRGSILRAFGAIGKHVIGAFTKDTEKADQVVATYFNGQVKEGVHRNTFLTSSTFETWGKSSIAKDRHTQTFGYANAWLVNPEDMQGRSDYTLVVEMGNHKLFYIFGFVSLFTLLLAIIYSMKRLILKDENNNK